MLSLKTQKQLVIICCAIVCWIPPIAQATITPSDVYQRVIIFTNNLKTISKALGKSHNDAQTLITVKNAAPREVYFQAQALFDKSNRLAYEITGIYANPPKMTNTNLQPSDVYQLVNAAIDRLIPIGKRLNLTIILAQHRENERTKTPTDVYNAILHANRILSYLLYKQVQPADSYEQITLAINYTANLLRQFKIFTLIPNAPPLIPEKTAKDTVERLLNCIGILHDIAQKSHLHILTLHMEQNKLHDLSAGDVYDISKVIVAEVRYLNTLLPDFESIKSYYPGYKTASEVYQRSGILLKQLQLLNENVSRNPQWLSHHNRSLDEKQNNKKD